MSASQLSEPLGRLVKRLGVRHAGRTAVAAIVTQLVVTALNLPQGYWAVITAVIVMQANIGGSIRAAWATQGSEASRATYSAAFLVFMPISFRRPR